MSGDSPNKYGRTKTRGGKGQAILAAKSNTEGELTLAQKSAVLATEARIRNFKQEQAYSIDRNGNVVRVDVKGTARQTSKGHSVRLDTSKIAEGGMLVHNHPQFKEGSDMAARIGASLSGNDIHSAISTNSAGIRASYPTYQYSLTSGGKGWGVDARTAQQKWQRYRDEAFSKYQRQITKAQLDYFVADRASSQAAYDRAIVVQNRINALISHQATRRLAKEYGWNYTRRKN